MAYIKKLNVGGSEYDISASIAADSEKFNGSAFSALFTTDGSAKSAVNATSADRLKTAQNIAASGDVSWSVSFVGNAGVTGTATVNSVPYSAISSHGAATLTANSASTTTGFASAAAVEKALATLQSEIGQIAAFDGPHTTTGSIPTPYKTNTIYLVGPIGEGEDKYEEYISTNETDLTKIGDTSIDMSQYQTTAGMSAYVQKADISAASAKWNDASAFAASASGNYSDISGYATDWNDTKTDLIGSANSGAAASAWISSRAENIDNTIDAVTGAVTTSTGMSEADNSGKLASVGAITGYVEDQLNETIEIAEEISDANASKIPYVSAVKNYVDGFSGNYVEYTDTAKSAVNINNLITVGGNQPRIATIENSAVKILNNERGYAAEFSLTGLEVKHSGGSLSANGTDVCVANANNSYSLTGVYTTVSSNSGSNWANSAVSGISHVNVYSAGAVNPSTYNSKNNDTIGFSAGEGINLAATADANNNPVITISAAKGFTAVAGYNGVSGSLTGETINVSGIDATTNTATNAHKGVTYASYVADETLYVF